MKRRSRDPVARARQIRLLSAVWGPFLSAGMLWACSSDSGCTNSVLERTNSPSAQYDAVVYVRACGATTSPGLSVSILPTNEMPPDEPGNVLRIVDVQVIAERPGDVSTRWLSGDTLQVSYEQGRSVYGRENSVSGITIVYDIR